MFFAAWHNKSQAFILLFWLLLFSLLLNDGVPKVSFLGHLYFLYMLYMIESMSKASIITVMSRIPKSLFPAQIKRYKPTDPILWFHSLLSLSTVHNQV